MKKILSSLLAAALLTGTIAVGGAMAESTDYVYGTMQIPYADFYAAEGVEGVDAVSSATDSKWQNEDLAAGTYNEAHTDDNGGNILGVVYPVAITQEDLDALGENNYGFTASEEAPEAYKIASVEDGTVSFSAVQGETSEVTATATLSTSSRYGDYQIDVDAINNSEGTSDIGTLYGVLLTTSDGSVYALRHLENIWLDKLAWSVGFTTTEAHGNTLVYEPYADIMGKTISTITYITESGYHTLTADLYVPVKFDGGVEAADAAVADGSTTYTFTNLPEDYSAEFAVDGLEATIADGTIAFESALPGSYTLSVTDASGVYAPLSASFILSTDELPVTFDAETGALVAAEGADADLAAAFIANISTVTVGENEYSASGRGAVAIITTEGTVDAEAAQVMGHGPEATSTPVFETAGDYTLTVASTGFNQTITFTVTISK